MAEERFGETDEGFYVQHGDILEWHWKDDPPKKAAPVTTETAAPVVKPKQVRKAAPKKAKAKK